jgi:Sortilin, neurotensin receptor 3,
MKELKIYFIIYLLFGFTNLQCQLVNCFNCIDKPVYKGDTVALNIPSFYGDLQWQKSIDLQSWSNLEYATSGMLAFVADSSAFYRARVQGGTCDPVYSDTIRSTVFTWNQWNLELSNIPFDWDEFSFAAIDQANDSSIWMNLYGEVVRSIDKGKNWQTKCIYANSISAVDSLHAWICAVDSGILSTADGGKNWTTINNQMTLTYYIHFFNLIDGFAIRISDTQEIYTTTDGGKNWEKVNIAFKDGEFTNADLSNDVIQYNRDTICLSTTNRILISYDKGNSWKWIETGLNDSVNIASFAMLSSRSFGFISKGNGGNDPLTLGFTIDAGAHWYYEYSAANDYWFQHILPVFGHIKGYILTKCNTFSVPSGSTWLFSENGLDCRKLDDNWTSCSISIGPDQFIGLKFPYCFGLCSSWSILLGKFNFY